MFRRILNIHISIFIRQVPYRGYSPTSIALTLMYVQLTKQKIRCISLKVLNNARFGNKQTEQEAFAHIEPSYLGISMQPLNSSLQHFENKSATYVNMKNWTRKSGFHKGLKC